LNRGLKTSLRTAALACALTHSVPCIAQTTTAGATAAAATPVDDTPALRVGATLFADYTVVQAPAAIDSDGNRIVPNAFNVGRAYINVTGRISHLVTFRITPDIFRESGAGSSLAGSYTFRLKYAYAQFNLRPSPNPTSGGTWIRLGMQQTPWVDFIEPVYRYRFQGMTFEDREGFSSSSDAGLGFHTSLRGDRGDLEAGIYNGETYARAEVNDQKAFMVRGTFRPFASHAVLHGFRATGFYDKDAYVRNADRTRAIVALTFEHKRLNAAVDRLWATDQRSTATPMVRARGYSVWATPRAFNGWEGLIRFDHLQPVRDLPGAHDRTLGGIAYWFPHQGPVASALLLDAEVLRFTRGALAQPTQRRFALHALVNF
jgi:hypothetical protein